MKKLVIGADDGLNLAVGTLSDKPTALVQANNVIIDSPGIIKSRKGTGRDIAQANDFSAPGTGANFLDGLPGMFYSPRFNNSVFCAQGVNSAKIADCSQTNGVTGAAVASPTYPANTRHGFAMGAENLYWVNEDQTYANPQRLPEIIRFQLNGLTADQKALPAGLPQPVFINRDTDTALNTNANSWMDDDEAVTYRCVFKFTDDSGVVHLSPPSERLILRKEAATPGFAAATLQSPILYFMLPPYGTPLYSYPPWNVAAFPAVFQIYRSRTLALTATEQDPGDELQLVYEKDFSASTVSLSGTDVFTFTDDAPPESLGIFEAPWLYTNATNGEVSAVGPGIANANFAPPSGTTMCMWKDCMWIGNIQDPPRQDYQLLSTAGIVAGDNIGINQPPGGSAAICITSAVVGAPAFENEWNIVTAGTVSYNIEKTSQNICAAINMRNCNAGTTGRAVAYASYTPGTQGAPGTIRLTGFPINLDTGNYMLVYGTGLVAQNFSPEFNSALSSVKTESTASTNTIAFSKQGIYEAFPTWQRIQVGRPEDTILRIFPYRNSLFVFTDAGVYRVTGNSAYDFQVESFDNTFVLATEACVSVCDDFLYAWGIQGILKMTENSGEYIHLPIEPLHLKVIDDQLFSQGGLNVRYGGLFVVAHQFRHKVYFFYASSDTYGMGCDKALVYDTRMGAWSTLTFNTTETGYFRVSCGAECTVNGKLYLQEFVNGTGDIYIRSFKDNLDDSGYSETDANNAEVPFEVTTEWVAIAGDPSKYKKFKSLQVYWNVSQTFPRLDKPSEPSALTFTSDTGSAAATLPTNGTSNLSYQSVPNTVTNSTRLKVTLTHNAPEYMGIEGIALTYNENDSDEKVTRADQ